jgi:hypothetical protein
MNKKLQTAVDSFNKRVPIGTPVRFWPGVKDGPGRESKTKSPAWLLGGHTPCVECEGYGGGIALTHVEVMR